MPAPAAAFFLFSSPLIPVPVVALFSSPLEGEEIKLSCRTCFKHLMHFTPFRCPELILKIVVHPLHNFLLHSFHTKLLYPTHTKLSCRTRFGISPASHFFIDLSREKDRFFATAFKAFPRFSKGFITF